MRTLTGHQRPRPRSEGHASWSSRAGTQGPSQFPLRPQTRAFRDSTVCKPLALLSQRKTLPWSGRNCPGASLPSRWSYRNWSRKQKMHLRHLPATPRLSDGRQKSIHEPCRGCALGRHSRAVESSPPWKTPRCPSTGKWARSVVRPNTGRCIQGA